MPREIKHTSFINASTTESAADMAATFKHFGMEDGEINTISDQTGNATEIDPATGESKQATPPVAVIDTAITPEVAKPVPTEPPTAEASVTDPPPADEPPPADAPDPPITDEDRAKHKKLLKQIDKLTGRLRTEETKVGSKEEELESLRQQVAELRNKVAQPASPALETDPAPSTPQPPKRPSRPKLEQFAFDQEKYEVAMDKYESDLDKYETDRDDFTRTQAVAQVRADQALAAQQAYTAERDAAWQEAKSAYPDIDEKLSESTGVISEVMKGVLRDVYEATDAWAVINYLADHPEESTRITQLTLTTARPNAGEVAHLAAIASRELAKLEATIQRSKAAKEAAAARATTAPPAPRPPAPAAPAVTPPPTVPATPAPPVTPKPPVSNAEPPIVPVTAHADGTVPVDLSSAETPASVYMAERQKQRAEKMRRQSGRA